MFNFCDDFVGRAMVTDAVRANTYIAGSNSKPIFTNKSKTMKDPPKTCVLTGELFEELGR